MRSYLTIVEDRETGEVNIKAKLMPDEKTELLAIRHFVVEHITRIVSPEVERVTFRLR